MANTEQISLGEYLSVGAAAVVAGVAGAMAWFNGEKKTLVARMEALEGTQDEWNDKAGEHHTQLAVLKACQENTAASLIKLEQAAVNVTNKLDAVLIALGPQGKGQ